MSLIPPPPNILGVPVAHPGLLPTSINSLLINGAKGFAENVGDSLTNISINFDIDGSSTVIVQVEDPERSLLKSQLGLERTVIEIDGVAFVLAEIDKQGPQLTMTFEHGVCSRLKDHTEVVSVLPGVMSRSAFCQKLVSYEGWILTALPAGESPGTSVVVLSTGYVDSTTGGALPLKYSTTYTELETFWDSTGTILGTIGWRRFPLGRNTLVMVSDEWLYTQPPIATIDEHTKGILTIDFNWDIRKPLGSMSITCDASTWPFPIGSVIAFTPNMGIAGVQSDLLLRFSPNPNIPPANGHWLVTNITRSLMSALATITLDVPNLTLTEVQTQPPTSAAAQVTLNSAPVAGQISSEQWAKGLLTTLQGAGYTAPITTQNIANIQRMIQGETAGNTAGFLRDNNPWNLNTYIGTQTTMPGGHMVTINGVNVQVFDSITQGYAAYVAQLEVNTNLLAVINASGTPDQWYTALATSGWSTASYASGNGFQALPPFTGSSPQSGAAAASGTLQTSTAPNSTVRSFVDFCMARLTATSGCTYVWAATGPRSFDCSGLVLAAMKSVGVNCPYHNSQEQWNWANGLGRAISVESALNTYGAVLIASTALDSSGHEAVSLGNGQLVNAYDTVAGIITGPALAANFDYAFLVPGLKY